jgi:uncharacterized repeat protein (TIGR01451 family)
LYAAILIAAVSGCAQHRCRLPAIDPTGRRIFSGSTTLACPNCLPAAPKAAWTTPATAPRCPVDAPHGPLPNAVATGNLTPVNQFAVPPGFAEEQEPPSPAITLTPQRFVAPVGSDVVLVAGLCSPQGRYVMRQPIEWAMAPEGVGHILEVGKESCQLSLCKTAPCKVNTTYAVAHTSSISQTVTRGTERCEDDVRLKRGQSWISVTSPNEGVSYVTAFAPKEHNWDRRKQTATIYWVDAKWTFPQPVSVRPSEPYLLKTKIVRTNGLPVTGWVVRYDILDGPPAGFGAAGEQTAEVATDARGEANLELLPRSNEAGITQLRVQIVRPNAANPAEPPMLVGQGYTHVQWSTPGLLVRGEVTQETRADGVINYRIEVVNNGDQITRDVVLTFPPPAGVTVQGSNPQAQSFGNRLEWRLGNIAPRTTRTVTVSARATAGGDLRSCFSARSADGLETPPTCFQTRVPSTALQLRVQGPNNANVNVGDEVKYFVEVTNGSAAVVTGVIARDTYDPGLEHVDRQASPIERDVGNLQPGETRRFTITFRVTRPGEWCHRLDVLSDAGGMASQRFCVRAAQQAVGSLRVQVAGNVAQAREGEVVVYTASVTNSGNVPLTNVRIDISPIAGLTPTRASDKFQQGEGTFFWIVPRIDPGGEVNPQLHARVTLAGDARISVRAVADGVAAQATETATRVLPGNPPVDPMPMRPIQPDPIPMNPAEVPRQVGGLTARLRENANPVPVGREVIFTLEIANERDTPDQDVVVRLTLPEGITFKAAEAPAKPQAVSPDGRTIDLAPIREVRPGEKLAPYRFRVTPQKPGKFKVTTQIYSASHPESLQREATIDVFGGGRP